MLFSAALLCALLQTPPPERIPAAVGDVIRMSNQGFTDETIVSYVRMSQTHIRMTPDLWRMLRALGVREPVLRALDPRPPSVIVVVPPPPPGCGWRRHYLVP